jgi:glycosyltransferase involved in cell wall biosynthesis
MSAMLVLFHCESNPGFAASSHEHTFLEMALRIVGSYDRIHYAYRTLENGMTPGLPNELTQIIELDTRWDDPAKLKKVESYIKQHNIKIVFGFDQPVKRPCYKVMRRAGVKHFVSYWGAPMSSINKGLKLLLKRIEVALYPHGPDHYIFQSEGMAQSAIYGRGIKAKHTSVVKTGIDTEKFKPATEACFYAHEQFNIPKDKKLVVFSGHMEERKGVRVICNTAVYLAERLNRHDLHFLILGNKPGQEKNFDSVYKGTKAESMITFGGYRKDIPNILRSCYAGMIASTGWDSFPMFSIEVAATELPLIVSDLIGLREAINERSGFLFPVGNHQVAAEKLIYLADNPEKARAMGRAGRQRVIKDYSRKSQVAALEKIVRYVIENNT